jgi:hypothetical protein
MIGGAPHQHGCSERQQRNATKDRESAQHCLVSEAKLLELEAAIAQAKRAKALIEHALICPHPELSVVQSSARHSEHAWSAGLCTGLGGRRSGKRERTMPELSLL